MRQPAITPPRLIALIAIGVALGVAIALPSLFEGDSASETSAVEIGEKRLRGVPAAERNAARDDRERGGRANVGERRQAEGGGSPMKRDGDAPGSTTEAGGPPPVDAARAPAGSAGGGPGPAGGSGGGSAASAAPSPEPAVPPTAVAPAPDDVVGEVDDIDDDVENDDHNGIVEE